MFGGVAIVTIIYVLVNIALLHVLPIPQMAASKFAAGDAMGLILASGHSK